MTNKGQLRVLFLEDSEEDADAVTRLLSRSGYKLITERVDSEASFRDALQKRSWDAIVADYHLPGWTANEALQVYKSSGLDIPFLLVSGLVDEETAVAAMRAGAHDFVTKGRLARLVPAIERELQETRVRAAQRRGERERALLAEAGRLLAVPLNYEEVLDSLARTVVGWFADWCVIDIADQSGALHRAHAIHADPVRQPLLDRLRKFQPSVEKSRIGSVFRSGLAIVQSEYSPTDDEVLDEEHRQILVDLSCTSFISVPLIASGHKLGVLSLCYSGGSHAYTDYDLDLASELARRAAIVLENARLYREAQEANRLKDQFLAMVSHELRTPLTPILGAVQMLKNAANNQELLNKATEMIERNARMQAQIVGDLLDVSRIVSGKLNLQVVPVDLPALVASSVEAIRLLHDGSQVQIETSIAEISGTVLGDASRLGQVLGNLLSNAVKFTPAKGKIAVSLRPRSPDRVEISVADTGKGIAPEFLPHVFDRFRQADTFMTRSAGGLGLGLAIARDLTELHGGQIRAYSEGVGKGATFVVELPTVDADLDTARLSSGNRRLF